MTTDLRLIGRSGLAALLLASVSCGGKGPTEPPMPTLASIAVTPASQTLVSVGETVQLQAAGKSSGGAAVSASFTWSSSAEGVATVSSTGLVTAVSDGSAGIVATSGSITGTAVITVSQEPASIGATQGDAQGGTVGAVLDSLVSVAVLDALGHSIAGVEVAFTPAAGAGTVDPATATSDAEGQASTTWTLGQTSGGQTVTASLPAKDGVDLQLSASAYADDPVLIQLFDGDDQIELTSTALPAPVRVQALDQFGNGVPDVPVNFAVTSDDALAETEVLTDLDGIAAAHWTLGTTVGAYQAQASVADSAVGDIVDLPGSPVTFTASAVAYDVSAVAAAPPVVGDTVTIEGMGFDPDASANAVTIGGLPATVVGGTQTSLSVEVPSFGCVPVTDRMFVVERGANADSLSVQVEPEGALRLAVGGRVVLDDPSDYCLQFLSGGTEEYLVGLTSTRRLSGEMSFSLVGYDGVGPAPVAPTAAPVARASISGDLFADAPELRLRDWEERFLASGVEGLSTGSLAAPVQSAAAFASGPDGLSSPSAAPVTGDVLSLRVPTITADPCNDYTAISATVLAVGPHVVIALDDQVTAGPLLLSGISGALNTLITTFSDKIWALGTQYFGLPSDLDGNQSITVVLSPVVQSLGVPALTTVVDHVARATCPSSDEGEIIYVTVPSAPTVLEMTDLFTTAQPDLAHHLTHIIQHARRLSLGGGALPLLVGEGQAETAIEIVGMAIRGDAPRLDYGAADLDPLGLWYRPRFDRLSYLFGWDGATGKVDGAPESCSLFGYGGLAVSCDPEYAPGMAWGFMRYITDRFGTGYPGGEEAFQQALVSASPTGDVLAGLEALLGTSVADVMVEWAMTLYTDGRVSAAASSELQFQSWNLEDVYGSLSAEQRLQPITYGFTSFAQASGVVGGGTSYTLISTGTTHGPLSVRARDPIGGTLSTAMAPRMWVVRVQ